MVIHSRIIITAALLCHLLLASGIVTSQTLPPNPGNPEILPAPPASQMQEEVTIQAVEQEKQGAVYHLRGRVEIRYRSYILQADEITYNSDTGDSELEGHVVLDGGPYDEHMEASHALYNVRSETGTFEHVVGTVGFKGRRSQYVLQSTNPFFFTGKMVEKHGPDHYLVRHGTVTTCELPHPKWQFNAQRLVVDVDGSAKIYHSDFRLMGLPVFYFPYVTHPVQKQERHSGLLIPSVGNSSTKGYIAGESVYWAINRSADLMLGGEYYSRRGWAQHADFRLRPSDNSYVYFNYSGVVDRGFVVVDSKGTKLRQDQGGEDARFQAERFFGTVRGVANVDYLSSFVYRVAFTDVYAQAIDSEVRSQIFLSNTTRGFHFNALAERYQNFQVCDPRIDPDGCGTLTQTELIRVLHTPSFFLSSEERRLENSPIYWSFEGAVEGLQRRQVGSLEQPKGLRTAPLVGRFDVAPTVAMPLQWRGWSLRPSLTLRDTFYTQRVGVAADTAEDAVLNRRSLETAVELRPPALSRVFERPMWGRKWKHVIEPRMRYDYVTGIDNFTRILRFDSSDVLANTNEVEYSLVNRFYAKRVGGAASDCDIQGMSTLTIGGAVPMGAVPWELPPAQDTQPCASGPREIVSWEIGQKYFFDPTFGHALAPGVRNVFATTADFTGIAFLNGPQKFAPLISRLRIETSPRTNTEWDLDYDLSKGRINGSTALVNYHFGQFTIGGGDAFLRVLDAAAGSGLQGPSDFHQLRLLAGYGQLNKRGLSAAASFGFDANHGDLQYATAQTTYNWDCCGLSLEYRRFRLGSVRNENQYRFSFTLANVGAFGNLRRQERLY